jgi:enoyl-CoA hydratase/carnithine racemase
VTVNDDLTIERSHHVASLRQNAPDRLNALTHDMFDRLATTWSALEIIRAHRDHPDALEGVVAFSERRKAVWA